MCRLEWRRCAARLNPLGQTVHRSCKPGRVSCPSIALPAPAGSAALHCAVSPTPTSIPEALRPRRPRWPPIRQPGYVCCTAAAGPLCAQTKASEADILAAVGDGGFSPEEFELLQELGTINIQQAGRMRTPARAVLPCNRNTLQLQQPLGRHAHAHVCSRCTSLACQAVLSLSETCCCRCTVVGVPNCACCHP